MSLASSVVRTRALLAGAVALVLAACGGGGSSDTPVAACSMCSAGKLGGTAAAGAALAGAELRVIGADGRSVRAVADASGIYSADVSTLTAPYVVQALANVGGQAVLLHSLATAADVGRQAVNVTPLTEVITADVLGADPQAAVAAGTVPFRAITDSALADAETALERRLAPVLGAAGLGSVDLRSTEFKADHSGLDGVLDALKVSQANGGYTITLVTGGGSITVDPANPAAPTTLAAPTRAELDALAAQLRDVQALLAEHAAVFAAGVPAEADLIDFFTADFLHNGQNRSEFITKVLRQVQPASAGGFSLQGVTFDAARIERVIDADTLEISFRSLYRKGFRPGSDGGLIKRAGGRWRFAGNGLLAHARVSLMARLKETALTEAQVRALPNIRSYTDTFEGPAYTYFLQTIQDEHGANLDLWLDRVGGASFGRHGWIGDEAGADRRLQRSKYHRYLAAANSRVSNYIEFWVPTNLVAADVAEIVVTGPGLPAGGLKLEPPIRRPRANWVFKGDAFDWNAFNGERCTQIDNPANPVPGCGIDWTQVHKGSEYLFTLKDAGGSVLGSVRDRLRTEPISEAEAYAKRNSLFPIFSVDDAHAFSIRNVYDDTAGPFMAGRTVALNWNVPTQPGYRLAGISLTTQTMVTDTLGRRVVTDHALDRALYDADPNAALPTTASFAPAHAQGPIWAWTTVNGIDAFGNSWSHELSPDNPR